MPRPNSLISRLRYGRAWDEWDEGAGDDDEAARQKVLAAAPRSRRRRLLVTLVFAVLFVAGAAFSASAGDQVANSLEGSATNAAAGDATTTGAADPASTDPNAPAEAPAEDPAPPAEPAPAPAPEPAPAPASDPSAPAASAPTAAAATAPAVAAAATSAVQAAATSAPVVKRPGKRSQGGPASRPSMRTMRSHARRHNARKRVPKAPPPELEGASSAVVWLNRAMPDPTPPALRLNVRFARNLQTVADNKHVDWALMLGVLRANGHQGSAPADFAGLRQVAASLTARKAGSGNPWAAMFALSNNTGFADRALALAHYYRAVGLRSLVAGLESQKPALEQKVLSDPRVSIYAGGRGDIESHRVNVRVLVAIEYLADTFGQVSVSCLISGHRLYARPGVISAHIYGLAADISTLANTSITGHQQPAGSVTERAVRDLLLLPPEVLPKQIISLLGLGGPSFPLANHYDHIHIGY